MKKMVFPVLCTVILAGCGEREPVDLKPVNVAAVTTDESSTTTAAVAAATNADGETTAVPDEYREIAEKKLAKMTLHEKVCQMFVVEPETICGYDELTYVDDWFTASYEMYPVGGFVYFDRNIESEDQLRELLKQTKELTQKNGIGAFLSVDEEGGSLTRVQNSLPSVPAMKDMAYYGELNDYNTTYNIGRTIGGYLADFGFNLDFAPVCDVNLSDSNELGDRIFSDDSNIVADMSKAIAMGLKSQNVCSCVKHFPGLGAGSGNTHDSTVLIDRSLDDLQKDEFPAFKSCLAAGTDFVMVGHQVTTAAGDDTPSDLSPTVVTDWLRGELGYDGIAITDSHKMGAIKYIYPAGEAASKAVVAGMDMILMPEEFAEAVESIEWNVENEWISEERIDESVMRILLKKAELGLIK